MELRALLRRVERFIFLGQWTGQWSLLASLLSGTMVLLFHCQWSKWIKMWWKQVFMHLHELDLTYHLRYFHNVTFFTWQWLQWTWASRWSLHAVRQKIPRLYFSTWGFWVLLAFRLSWGGLWYWLPTRLCSRQTGSLNRTIDRGTRAINFILSSMVFNVVPTLLEVQIVLYHCFWVSPSLWSFTM